MSRGLSPCLHGPSAAKRHAVSSVVELCSNAMSCANCSLCAWRPPRSTGASLVHQLPAEPEVNQAKTLLHHVPGGSPRCLETKEGRLKPALEVPSEGLRDGVAHLLRAREGGLGALHIVPSPTAPPKTCSSVVPLRQRVWVYLFEPKRGLTSAICQGRHT